LKIRVSLVRFRVRAPYKTRPCSNAGPFCYVRLVEIWHLPVDLASSGHRTANPRSEVHLCITDGTPNLTAPALTAC
jgi:hypothetical protein